MIKAIPLKKDVKAIADELVDVFNEILFDPLRELTSLEIVENSRDDIRRLMESGKIEYVDGVLKGDFTVNAITTLERLDQKWNGLKRGYEITDPQLNSLIGSEVARYSSVKDNVQRLLTSYNDVQLGIDTAPTDKAIDNVLGMAKKNVPEKNIQTYKDEKKDFAESVDASSVAFLSLLLVKLSNDVNKARSIKDIKQSLDIRFGQTKRRVNVIADDGAFFFGSRARQKYYQKQGISSFRWVTKMDGKVRESHRKLNGEIFQYDNPPIVDGRPILPGEDFGCRCTDMPIKPVPNKL